MDPLVLGGIIGGAGSLFGGLFNAKGQKDAGKYNADLAYKASQNEIAWARQQQQIANDFNVQMWNRQNEYNTPQAQMQRFKDAGLNPALMYSQGNTGNAQSVPTFESIQPSPSAFRAGADAVPFVLPQLGNVLNHMISTLSAAADLQNKEKQGKYLDAQIGFINNKAFLDSIRGNYIGDELARKLRDSDQNYYLRGGDFTAKETKELHDFVMMDRSLSPKFRESQIELYSAMRAAKLQGILTDMARRDDIKASENLKRLQAQFQEWKNHEYEHVWKPYNEALGPFRPAAEAVGGASLDILSTLLEMYMTKGSSTLKDVLEEFTTTPKGHSARTSKRTVTKSYHY